jgi:hypothetical protein
MTTSLREMIDLQGRLQRLAHAMLVCPRACTICEEERNWPEDFSHENGQYYCSCVYCGERFVGHKRRVVCRRCHRRYRRK